MSFSYIIEKYWNSFYSFKSTASLCKAIDRQLSRGKHVPHLEIFTRVFQLIKPEEVKCIFLAPTLLSSKQKSTYITNGLVFSSGKQFEKHQSTKNIHTELQRTHPDINIPSHGDLSNWCKQGLLMIPVRFTFDPDFKQEYQFWNMFSSTLLEFLYELNKDIVVVLFGSQMREFLKSGSMKKCYFELIQVPHPSVEQFIGCQLFQKIDSHYKLKGWNSIDWEL